MVPPGGSAHILQSDRLSVQHVACYIHSTDYRGSGKNKEAKIRPLYLKHHAPKQHADYCPTSITPIMSRLMERNVVRTFLYPTFLDPPSMQSGILGLICFRSQWLHISCNHLPTSHRYQPAAIQSFSRRHLTGLFQGVRHRSTFHDAVQVAELDLRRLSTTG